MVITARDFRASQSQYIGAAYRGEEVVVKAKAGDFKVVPVEEKDTKTGERKDLTAELCSALQQVAEHIQGKRRLKTADELLYELRNKDFRRI